MRIVIHGGGPAGLYAALLARQHLGAEVAVFEQNPRGATYGFGIVLADRGLRRMMDAHPESCERIMQSCFLSRHRIIAHMSERVFIEGGGYGGAIARLRLLEILEDFCERAGVEVQHGRRMAAADQSSADLVIGADGVNSAVRTAHGTAFGTIFHRLTNRLAWYGTRAPFPYPILSFRTTPLGRFWCVGYAYTETMSTFVAECDASTWAKSLQHLTDDERTSLAAAVFAEELGGNPLLSNNSHWQSLAVTRVATWSVNNTVLIGDALHSAHPSIGSGTRIAMEDAIVLVESLQRNPDIPAALAAFRRAREPAKQKLLTAMEKSIAWYETIADRLESLKPVPLVFDYMMRTGRIDEARLVAEFPHFMARHQNAWRAYAAA